MVAAAAAVESSGENKDNDGIGVFGVVVTASSEQRPPTSAAPPVVVVGSFRGVSPTSIFKKLSTSFCSAVVVVVVVVVVVGEDEVSNGL